MSRIKLAALMVLIVLVKCSADNGKRAIADFSLTDVIDRMAGWQRALIIFAVVFVYTVAVYVVICETNC